MPRQVQPSAARDAPERHAPAAVQKRLCKMRCEVPRDDIDTRDAFPATQPQSTRQTPDSRRQRARLRQHAHQEARAAQSSRPRGASAAIRAPSCRGA